MHFDDANDKFKNDGAGTATIEIGANESIVEGGKFGSYLKDAIGNTRISTALGGSDFTIEYFTKCLASTTKANDLKATQGVFAVNDEDTTETYFRAPTADRTGILVQYKLGYGLLDWTHCAFCYDHTAGEVNLYVGGVLRNTWQVTYAEMATEFAPYLCADELRIVKGACIYTENFTPPVEPF